MKIGDTLRINMDRYDGPLSSHNIAGTFAELTYVRKVRKRLFEFSMQLPALPNAALAAPITVITSKIEPIIAILRGHHVTMEHENRFSETVHLFRLGVDHGSIDECKIMARTMNYP